MLLSLIYDSVLFLCVLVKKFHFSALLLDYVAILLLLSAVLGAIWISRAHQCGSSSVWCLKFASFGVLG